MVEKVTTTDDGQGRKYWTQVPNIVLDLGLRPIPLALYLHLKRVAGDTSFSDETTRQLADRLECSPMAVSKALVILAEPREELGGKALVKTARIGDGKGARKPRIIVTIADIWPENMAKYGLPAVTIVDGSEDEAVNNMYGSDESRTHSLRGRKLCVHPKEQEKQETPTPVGEGANGAPSGDGDAPADIPARGPTPAQRDTDRAMRHSLGLDIAADVGVNAQDAVYKRGKQAGRLNADFGEMVGQVRAAAGSYPAAFLVWGAFRESVPDDQWERFGSIGAVKTRFNRWAANGGGPVIEQARAMFGGAAVTEGGE